MLPELFTTPLRALSPQRRDDFFGDYQRTMNRFIKDAFYVNPDRLVDWQDSTAKTFLPSLDYHEEDDKIVVSAELPGLSHKEVEVTVEENVLIIRGEKKEEKEERGKGKYFTERRYGSFERSMTLPTKTDKEKIAASFDKGVLKVTIPKLAEAAKDVKKIAIKH